MDFRDIHLQVLYSFSYETKGGRKISITEGEKLFLIKKTNADWWQVIRKSSERPFFVPASYVEEIKYGKNRTLSSKPLLSANSKCNTDCPNVPSNRIDVFNETSTASCAAFTDKEQTIYSNLSSVTERISSEKWRLWAAEELISELACSATPQPEDTTGHSNVTYQRTTSEQSLDKTHPDSCANSLSRIDKGTRPDHKAHFTCSASCSDESLFPVKKGDIVRRYLGNTFSGEHQAEVQQTFSTSLLHEAVPECQKVRVHLSGSGAAFKSSCDVNVIPGESGPTVDCCAAKNTDRCVPHSKAKNKEITVIPENQEINQLSGSESICSSGKRVAYGSFAGSHSENHLHNSEDTVQDFQVVDLCSARTDMFSKMKSKLKYSTSFKTKRELQKLSERREGNSVLSSSWDKLDNFQEIDYAGHAPPDNSRNTGNGSGVLSNLKSRPQEKIIPTSATKVDLEKPAVLHHIHYSDGCLTKENTLKSDSECDCNANYTLAMKEKSNDDEFVVCDNPQVEGDMSGAHDTCKEWSDSEHSEDLLCSSDGTSKSQKITSSCESIEDWRVEERPFQPELLDVVSIPLPDGWVQSYDEQLDLPCYIHEKSGEKWFSSNDAEGRVYFYQENSTESSWRLPEVPSTMLEEAPSEKSAQKEAPREKEKPTIIVSSDDSQIRHQHETENRPTFRMTKARSMVLTDTKSKEGSTKSSSIPRNYLPFWDGRVHTLKEGMLNKTKMWEIGGKKVRKNWTPSYVVLSKFHLLFFKDVKTYTALKLAVSLGCNSGYPDLWIDLKGALVEESERLSSRKYVFAISTIQGLKVLLQCDEKALYTDWYQAVRNAIRNITEGSGLRNSCSTKDVGSFLSQAISPNQSRKILRIDRSRSMKTKNREGSLEDLASSPDDQQIGIHTRLKNFFLRRPLKEALEQRGILRNEAVFGCHLPDVCHEEPYIPLFVSKCVQVIESKDENMQTVGLYRASGNLSQVQKIRLQVNQDNYKVMEEEDDVHVLTGALKLFFRELKEPVIPCKLFSKALEASSKPLEEEKLKDFREIVKSLPKTNRCTLEFLLKHLLRVTEYKSDNQMSIHTLAIVFGPSLMWPEEESQNIAFDYMMQNVVIEFLLKAFHDIFGDSCGEF